MGRPRPFRAVGFVLTSHRSEPRRTVLCLAVPCAGRHVWSSPTLISESLMSGVPSSRFWIAAFR